MEQVSPSYRHHSLWCCDGWPLSIAHPPQECRALAKDPPGGIRGFVPCFLDIYRSSPVDLTISFHHSSLYLYIYTYLYISIHHTYLHISIYIHTYLSIHIYIYILHITRLYNSFTLIFPTSAMDLHGIPWRPHLLQDVEHVVSPAPLGRLRPRLAAQQLQAARLRDVAGAARAPGEGHVLQRWR